jgi:flagellar basal body P-ring protein FlgI
MGQKAKNAGMKKRSPKKEAIDRLSKRNPNVRIHNANYEMIQELADIISFGKPLANRRNSKDIKTLILNEMSERINENDTKVLSKLW